MGLEWRWRWGRARWQGEGLDNPRWQSRLGLQDFVYEPPLREDCDGSERLTFLQKADGGRSTPCLSLQLKIKGIDET
jgi:hypothetical protein